MRRIIGIGVTIIVTSFLILALRPLNTSPENRRTAEGILENIHEGPSADIVFQLKEQEMHYYINRGLEQGLSIDNLEKRLIGQKVKIEYVHHWTPLDPSNSSEHMTRLQFEGLDIYREE